MSAFSTIWILGAPDAEMTAIESLLRDCGQAVHYAIAGTGRRVAPGQPAVSYEGAPEVGPEQLISIEVAGPFEVVVTTNSGYPLDQNLYQAVKGMSAAAQVVRDGGTIFCAAECRDGLPDHGRYAETLRNGASPSALLAEIESRTTAVPDQWQVQVQALIQRRARVQVKSALDPEAVRRAHFEPVDDLDEAVGRALAEAGAGARVCVLPEGPQTIPYLAP